MAGLWARSTGSPRTLWSVETDCVLIIRDPDETATAGQLCRQPVSLMDLYRTIHARCNLPVPNVVEGRDLSYLIRNPDALWDDALLATLNETHHTFVEHSYRYIRYNDSDRELYDHAVDPHEHDNLILVPEYADLANHMETRLTELLEHRPRLTQEYLFEDNLLDTAPDRHDGIVHGQISFDSGARPQSTAICLDGTEGYVEIPHVATTDLTIAFWINTTQQYPSTGIHWYDGAGIINGDVIGLADDYGIALVNDVLAFGTGNPDTTVFPRRRSTMAVGTMSSQPGTRRADRSRSMWTAS